ncbi:MAG TPA: hypothetical protein DCP28_12115 [Cytophagales bacterium]|nr:hypothetical protein [Cytophagales bacterium]
MHTSQGILTPRAKTLKSEPAIIAGIAEATLPDSPLDWSYLVRDYSRIRDLIADTLPGFEDYNQRLEQENGFALPNGPREGKFTTPSQKAHFTINQLSEVHLGKGEFLMMTIRSHDQFNTTVYGLDDRYRGVFGGRRVIFMHPEDIKELGLNTEGLVDLQSHYNGQLREVKDFQAVPYALPRRCAATYFPETNPLVPLSLHARGSHTPASKSVVITISQSH